MTIVLMVGKDNQTHPDDTNTNLHVTHSWDTHEVSRTCLMVQYLRTRAQVSWNG